MVIHLRHEQWPHKTVGWSRRGGGERPGAQRGQRCGTLFLRGALFTLYTRLFQDETFGLKWHFKLRSKFLFKLFFFLNQWTGSPGGLSRMDGDALDRERSLPTAAREEPAFTTCRLARAGLGWAGQGVARSKALGQVMNSTKRHLSSWRMVQPPNSSSICYSLGRVKI